MKKLYIVGFVCLYPVILLSQTENWVYRYNGPAGDHSDEANAIVYGADGNVYAAGRSYGTTFNDDFFVVSLTAAGDTNWTYRYNGSADQNDEAYAIVYGDDGNIYVAGITRWSGASSDFTVISLNPNGLVRWIYHYNGAGNGADEAFDLVYGADGNVYAAGVTTHNGSGKDFIVISFDAVDGDTNWTYRYNGPGNSFDQANSITYGADGHIYAAGYSYDENRDFTVISLRDNGLVRWISRYDGPDNGMDEANAIIQGPTGNIFAAGYSTGIGSTYDFFVISLTDDQGDTIWTYHYDGSDYDEDEAYALVFGDDGNIYAAGRADEGNWDDLAVVSLDPLNGDTNWVYTYDAAAHQDDIAYSLVYGDDENLYIAGYSAGLGTSNDFIVTSMTDPQNIHWTYRYNGPGNSSDRAHAICYGDDGNVYAAGYSYGSGTSYDFTVISLAAVGIEENHIPNPNLSSMKLEAFPNPFRQITEIKYCVGRSAYGVERIALDVYDVTGHLVKNFKLPTPYSLLPTSITWDGTDNSGKEIPNGVYFLKLDMVSTENAGEFSETKKLLFLK